MVDEDASTIAVVGLGSSIRPKSKTAPRPCYGNTSVPTSTNEAAARSSTRYPGRTADRRSLPLLLYWNFCRVRQLTRLPQQKLEYFFLID